MPDIINTMNKQETIVILKCDSGCSMLVVDKTVWDSGEVDYNISVEVLNYSDLKKWSHPIH